MMAAVSDSEVGVCGDPACFALVVEVGLAVVLRYVAEHWVVSYCDFLLLPREFPSKTHLEILTVVL